MPWSRQLERDRVGMTRAAGTERALSRGAGSAVMHGQPAMVQASTLDELHIHNIQPEFDPSRLTRICDDTALPTDASCWP